jgi:hypothetical protein
MAEDAASAEPKGERGFWGLVAKATAIPRSSRSAWG